ncbi:MAG TPA: hypothetical protein VJY35_02385 [Candidatus Eisenbacteria bacterium]|nr:hypothetical protein [Candidatus Eisenbacteria bacterium]
MSQLRRRRETAAEAHRPKHIKLLLIAEAPPDPPGAYFYYPDPGSMDPLFDGVCHVLFDEPASADKPPRLKELRRRGVFVIELAPDGAGGNLDELAQWLPLRVETLAPDQIVLIGASVHRAGFKKLEAAGLPVVDKRVVAPEAGDRAAFAGELRSALVRAGLEKLIKPLPRPKASG